MSIMAAGAAPRRERPFQLFLAILPTVVELSQLTVGRFAAIAVATR
jgi:hypothetical protein